MMFQVEITSIAEAEIEQSYCWYRERSSDFADQWFRGLMNAMYIRHGSLALLTIDAMKELEDDI